jgi:hypothetical protein
LTGAGRGNHLRAGRVALLSAPVAGRAWQVLKDLGDLVQKGELPALVDAPEVGKAKAEFLQALLQVEVRVKTFERQKTLPADLFPPPQRQEAEAHKKETDKNKDAAKHDDWWCEEHGVPEAECIMCNDKQKNEAKDKGDWCQHNRAKSQCFECDPSLKEKFAAKYRAKYPGKEPPRPTDYD